MLLSRTPVSWMLMGILKKKESFDGQLSLGNDVLNLTLEGFFLPSAHLLKSQKAIKFSEIQSKKVLFVCYALLQIRKENINIKMGTRENRQFKTEKKYSY